MQAVAVVLMAEMVVVARVRRVVVHLQLLTKRVETVE
jgi:hypothetical protein